jgi:hypothetical protein
MAKSDHMQPKRTPAEQLSRDLHLAFEYTRDNNRDLLEDTSFPMDGTVEEIQLEFCWQFIVAYIARNADMVNSNLRAG